MDTSWGVWDPADRGTSTPILPADALPPEQVAQLIVWMASAPADLVLNEVTVTPLTEQGWP
jgi:NADP-dependent 3-hydroxy acid dehydrogenase YdfG